MLDGQIDVENPSSGSAALTAVKGSLNTDTVRQPFALLVSPPVLVPLHVHIQDSVPSIHPPACFVSLQAAQLRN